MVRDGRLITQMQQHEYCYSPTSYMQLTPHFETQYDDMNYVNGWIACLNGSLRTEIISLLSGIRLFETLPLSACYYNAKCMHYPPNCKPLYDLTCIQGVIVSEKREACMKILLSAYKSVNFYLQTFQGS